MLDGLVLAVFQKGNWIKVIPFFVPSPVRSRGGAGTVPRPPNQSICAPFPGFARNCRVYKGHPKGILQAPYDTKVGCGFPPTPWPVMFISFAPHRLPGLLPLPPHSLSLPLSLFPSVLGLFGSVTRFDCYFIIILSSFRSRIA